MKYIIRVCLAVLIGLAAALYPTFKPVGGVSPTHCKNPNKPCTTYTIKLEQQ